MGLDIFFSEDAHRILAALDEANAMANDLALTFGADKKEIQLARYAYQSALAHVGRAFGLQSTELVMISKGQMVYHEEGWLEKSVP